MAITSAYYGRTADGREVYQHTLCNDAGLRVCIIEYGCIITHIFVTDLQGEERDVVLGYNSLEDYEHGTASLGAFVGRVANRIEDAKFAVGGKTYTLTPNDGKNHLHGVLQNKVFESKIEDDKLVLFYRSPNGEEDFPGNLDVTVTYSLTESGALVLDYVANTDAATIVNFTNHSYFNLEGAASGSIAAQTLQIAASTFTESNSENCPTGRILPVAGTPLDFTTPQLIGLGLASDNAQIQMAGGYDHNFVLDKEPGRLARVAVAHADKTGITMETYTTQPGLQLYTANFLQNDTRAGKTGGIYGQHQAFCLETQHFPCAPSHPEFPSIVLLPEDEYHETTIYKFIVDEASWQN
ncbi:MAG: aldose epimerase family protein [Ruthenibacterium sp.]